MGSICQDFGGVETKVLPYLLFGRKAQACLEHIKGCLERTLTGEQKSQHSAARGMLLERLTANGLKPGTYTCASPTEAAPVGPGQRTLAASPQTGTAAYTRRRRRRRLRVVFETFENWRRCSDEIARTPAEEVGGERRGSRADVLCFGGFRIRNSAGQHL